MKGNTKHTFRGKERPTKLAWMDTLSVDKIPSVLNQLFVPTTLGADERRLLQLPLEQFARAMIRTVSDQRDVKNLRQFYDACKRRYQDLSELVMFLLSADDEGLGVQRVDSKGEHRAYLIGRRNRKVVLTGGQDGNWFLKQRNPGCYRYLFRCLPDLLAVLQMKLQGGLIDSDKYMSDLRDVCLVISTMGKIYEDIRGGSAFEDSEYDLTITRMGQTHDLDHGSEWYGVYQSVVQDIREGIDTGRPKRYVRDICLAIPRELRPFGHTDYHVSFRSTGTRYNNRSLPGLYAAIVETDPLLGEVDDELIGYTSEYNQSLVPSVEQIERKSIMITQHKLDYRLIHMAANAIQDRASYYHNRLAKVLDKLLPDCTTAQGKGKTFAQLVTSPKYRSEHHNNIYCLDISKATDTLNQEFQQMCMEVVFGPQHAGNWRRIVSGTHKLVKRGVIVHEFEPSVGQPQGYKSSFPAFAWVHHIVMRMVMKHNGLENTEPSTFYRVLGDDSIISHPDPEENILRDYIGVCSWINWTVHPSKGYLYRWSIDNDMAFAEFAKVRYLNGKVCTPIPIRLLTKSVDSPSGMIGFLAWIAQNGVRPVYISEVLDRVTARWPLTEVQQIAIFYLQLVPDTLYSVFRGDWQDVIPDNQTLGVIYTAYMMSKIEQTLLDQFIPDDFLEVPMEQKKERTSPFLDSKLEDILLPLAENPNNKYWRVLEHNELLINALSELFGPVSLAVGALHLTDKEVNAVYSACEYLMSLEYGGTPTLEEAKPVFDEALKVLSRYNPRSDVRHSLEQGELLPTIERYVRRIMAHVANGAA